MMKNNKLAVILSRYAAVIALVLLLCGWISFRLVDNTVIHASNWNNKADSLLNEIVTVYPDRGDILACDGSVLATNVNVYTLRIDYRTDAFMEARFRQSVDSLADSLAAYFPIRDKKGWKEHLMRPLKVAEKSARTRNHTLLKEISYDQYKLVRRFPFFEIKNCNRTGLTKETHVKRLYPYGEMARRSIGRTNQPKGRLIGYSGLEYALDSLLSGTPGKARRIPLTRNIVPVADTPAINGATVVTTIDVEMQDIVEDELNAILTKTKAQWGTAILMEVSTGDIKAISNLERKKGDSSYCESMNHAIAPVEPGSVVKLVGMIIAMEDGFASNTNKTFVTERGGFRYQNAKAIKDTHFSQSGSLPIYSLLEYSSNIGMTKLVAPHFEHNPDSYRLRVGKLGLFDRFGTGIAGEQPAFYPRLANNRGGRIAMSRMIYGYTTQIAPLYTCALYNAIANDGAFVRPRLVKGLKTSDGRDSTIAVSYVRESICSPANAKQLRYMLRRVLTEKGGTAKGINSDLVEIAGKTGTALISKERPKYTRADTLAGRVKPFVPGYLEGHYRLAFVGFFPYDKPKYTCMVVIADPAPGIRSAQYTSGATVVAIAENLYSRGMLDNSSDFRVEVPESPQKYPELYATTSNSKVQRLENDFGFDDYGHFSTPVCHGSGIPDVVGLGVREALVLLEESGFVPKFSGAGYVAAQSPLPGTDAPYGSTVMLTLGDN